MMSKIFVQIKQLIKITCLTSGKANPKSNVIALHRSLDQISEIKLADQTKFEELNWCFTKKIAMWVLTLGGWVVKGVFHTCDKSIIL